jgi:hypothetical protein
VMERISQLRPTRQQAIHFLTKQCRLDEAEAALYADMCLAPAIDPMASPTGAEGVDDGAV